LCYEAAPAAARTPRPAPDISSGPAEKADTVEPSPPATPPAADIYAAVLKEDDLQAYLAAPPTVDLTFEIRLIRALITLVAAEGLLQRELQLRLALAVLCRLAQAQGSGADQDSELQRELLAVAASILEGVDADTADEEME